MELISKDDVIEVALSLMNDTNKNIVEQTANEVLHDVIQCVHNIPTIEERKIGEWIRTGRTNVYGGEELMCPFCGDRVMVQYIEYELYCRQCGALLGDRVMEEDEGE